MASPRNHQRSRLDAEARLFAESWYPLMVECCRPWQTRNPSLRDEIESESHLALIDLAIRRDEIEEPAAFLNWRVGRAAMRAILQARPLGYKATGGGPSVGGLAGSDAESRDDPVAEIHARETRDRVASLLPPRQVAIVDAVVFGSETYQGAADDLGIAVGTVRTHVNRAFATLRSEWSKEDAS